MNDELPVIVVVDHEAIASNVLRDNLAHRATIVAVTNVEEAELALLRQPADVLICRDDLPGETGLMFLTRYRATLPWQKRILLCPALDGDLALTLINETNVFRCLTLPSEPALLVQTVEVALYDSAEIKSLVASQDENRELRQQLAQARQTQPTFFSRWVRALPRLLVVASVTCLILFSLGVLTLLAIYLLKTLLGIDLVPGAHLSDAL